MTNIRDYSADELLIDRDALHIRALRSDDKAALRELFERLSPDTVYHRFLGVKKRLTAEELVDLTELDFHRKAALVASLGEGDAERIVGVGRYACEPAGPDDRAEVAVTVEDAEKRRGIGTLLLKHLMLIAAAEGIERFEGWLLSDNAQMLRILEKTGLVIARSAEGGLCHLIISTLASPSTFPAPPEEISPGQR